jgi:PAS domain S-box-containing protein
MTNENPLPKRLQSAELLLSILDNLPTSTFVKDEALRFVYSNKAHDAIIGKPESELLGKSDKDFWPDEHARGYLAHDNSVLSTGKTSISEEAAKLADGHDLPLLTRKSKLAGPDGKTYLIGTNSDLSDIRSREMQHRALTETVPVGIAQIEEDGSCSFANPLFLAYCGGDGTDQNHSRFIANLARDNTDFPGRASRFEADVQGIGQEPRKMIVISSGWLRLGAGKRSAIISLVDTHEMTQLRERHEEVKRLNEELADKVQRLKEAQDELVKRGRMEQLGQLIATVAHELRNPLGAVRTSAFLLERKVQNKGLDIGGQLSRINAGIERCDKIISQLLDFSRNKPLNCQASDLDDWLVRIVEEESQRMVSAITITCDLRLNGMQVPFDPSRLQRAVVNLLSNASEALVGAGNDASKFTHTQPAIHVSTRAEQEGVVLSVNDNGPGMPPEVLAKIREPLFTTKSFGTGLGVPAIEQIAIQHGGRLDIQSAPGNGALFEIFLPFSKSSEEAA